MSALLDKDFIDRISYKLNLFKWVRPNLGLCRCPICGDSKKSKVKCRFYFYRPIKNNCLYDGFSVSCKNCGYSHSFYHFLEEYDTCLFDEYRLERYKEKGAKFGTMTDLFKKKEEKFVVPQGAFIKEKIESLKKQQRYTLLDRCVPLSKLDENNICLQYIKSRKIPLFAYDILWYTDNFKETAKAFSEDELSTDNLPENEPRLVIPFFDANLNLTCIQGRSLNPKSKMRYITIKKNEFSSKLFGVDRVDWNKPVHVVEGPIDSLFVPNCIATADSNLMSCGYENAILIPDVQPRNRELCKQIEKFIDSGYSVSLIPEDSINGKDINEWVKSGMSLDAVHELINKSVVKGLKAKMQFAKWKKI